MSKNIKITLGSIYLIILITFLYFLFSKFDISRIDDFSYYKTIQTNIDDIIGKNLIFNLIIFFIFSVIWIVLLGFGSPPAYFIRYFIWKMDWNPNCNHFFFCWIFIFICYRKLLFFRFCASNFKRKIFKIH